MDYKEERTFVIRLQGQAEFPPDYDGEADGYGWTDEFDRLKSRVYAAIMRELALSPSFTAHPANRGRPADEEVTIVCQLRPAALGGGRPG